MNPLLLFEKSKLLLSLPNYGRLIVRLYRDGRVPIWLKMAGLAAAVLVVSPLDPFADIPFLNMLDDAALLMLAAKLFVNLAPAAVVAEHRIALGIAGAVSGMKNVTPGRV
ncbi:MAG TPA: hypothetical protein VEV38_03025 [Candidatus Eremiobacteraceae bacterium]|nr:hypothetical protein [Candidatus Eremiobacteraceae bacterium]